MKRLLIAVFFLIPLALIAQESVDAIEQRMNQAQGEEQVRLMVTLGNSYLNSDPERALELGLKAAFLSKRLGSIQYEGQSLLLMGMASLNTKQTENAVRYFTRALTHFEKNNQPAQQIKALKGIADVYAQVRNFEMASLYLNRALEVAKKGSELLVRVELVIKMGEIAFSKGDHSAALDEFSRVNELLADEGRLSVNELVTKVNVQRQIGLVYRNMGQFDMSLVHFRKASAIGSRIGSKPLEVENLTQVALTHYLMQKLDSSLIYYNQVLSYYQLKDDSSAMVNVLLGIGDVFFGREQYQQAVASFNRSYHLATKKAMVQEQVTSLVNLSRCFSATGDYPSSSSYLTQALAIANKHGLTSSAADVYLYLSQANEKEGRFLQALEYFKLWSELRDSIYSEESGKKLARIQILYEITQKEKENEILRQNSEIQNLQLTKTRYQRMVFTVLALFLFALLVLFALFYSSKQKEFIKQKETEQRIIEMNKNLEKRMILEIKKQEKQQLLLAQKSKLESLGTLAAGIAHEINQPLGGLSMGLDNILIKLSEKSLTDEYLKQKVNLLFESVDRIKRIIDHTRTFSRSHRPASFEKVDLNEVVNDTLLMVMAQYSSHNVYLDVQLTENIDKVVADKFKLEQVVLNLLSNSKFAVDEKYDGNTHVDYVKHIKVSTWQDADYVCVSVYDNGTGIKKKDIERIFDPFYTTKKVDKGTGLGLSISYGFIKDLLGEIAVDSKEGEFTQFDVKIPKT